MTQDYESDLIFSLNSENFRTVEDGSRKPLGDGLEQDGEDIDSESKNLNLPDPLERLIGFTISQYKAKSTTKRVLSSKQGSIEKSRAGVNRYEALGSSSKQNTPSGYSKRRNDSILKSS